MMSTNMSCVFMVPPSVRVCTFCSGIANGGGGLPNDERVGVVFVGNVGNLHAEVAGIRRVQQCRFDADHARADETLELTVEVLHAVEGAVAHGVDKRTA